MQLLSFFAVLTAVTPQVTGITISRRSWICGGAGILTASPVLAIGEVDRWQVFIYAEV